MVCFHVIKSQVLDSKCLVSSVELLLFWFSVAVSCDILCHSRVGFFVVSTGSGEDLVLSAEEWADCWWGQGLSVGGYCWPISAVGRTR